MLYIQLSIILMIIALGAPRYYETQLELLEERSIESTAYGLQQLEKRLLAYYSANNQWPLTIVPTASANGIAELMNTGFLPVNFINKNGHGKPYQLQRGVNNSVDIVTELNSNFSAINVAYNFGGFASPTNKQVSLNIFRPGAQPALNAYLPRDGSLPMTGTLEAQHINATSINNTGNQSMNGTLVIHGQTTFNSPIQINAPLTTNSKITAVDISVGSINTSLLVGKDVEVN